MDSLSIKQHILNLLRTNRKSLNSKQIAAALELKGSQWSKRINSSICDLLINNKIVEKGKYKYCYNSSKKTIPGIIDINSSGNGYLKSTEHKEDIFISRNNLHNCLNKDSVLIHIIKNKKNRIEGKVIEVIERANIKFIGSISIKNKTAFFIPDNIKTGSDFFIPKDKLNNAVDGDQVIVKFLEWPSSAGSPFGEVLKIIITPDSLQSEIESNIEIFNIRNGVSTQIQEELLNINSIITKKDINTRKDIRHIKTCTIDPKDAKDFDDAISIEFLRNQNIKIGVHIADVGHYVKPNSDIDKEAYLRGFSVYFPGKVVPMLPEKLSNDICSLKPNEDRLAFSVIVEFNAKHEIIQDGIWMGKTIIHSDKRLSYELAQDIIDGKNKIFNNEIKTLNNVAKHMRFQRLNSGSINFERTDIRFELDSANEPLRVVEKKPLDSHKLVEEFMLLANRLVATQLTQVKPSIYRVHDLPDVNKLQELSIFLKSHNQNPINTNQPPKGIALEINKILQNNKNNNNKNIIELMVLRSMSKAKYSVNNIGHYGLGFEKYTHFTSPIRRYADLIAHRILYSYLKKEKFHFNELETKCVHFSSIERIYIDLERKVNKFAQLKLLTNSIGRVFSGTISGVMKWGIYVDLDGGKGEGLISINDLKGDKYDFNDQLNQFMGRRKRKKYILGEKIDVEIKSINLTKKEMDLILI